MYKIEILNMEPGAEMDLLIMKRILGVEFENEILEVISEYLPKYSSDWNAIKLIIDKMSQDGFSVEIIIGADGNTMASFFTLSGDNNNRYGEMVCETMPAAVCKAALLTKLEF